MAGIYLHIPYCRQACHYCNFHFSTTLKNKKDLLQALEKEIVLRKNFLEDTTLDTIYFGGGTPSLLEENEIQSILNTLKENFEISSFAEVSIEVNPEDISAKKMGLYAEMGINRISMGIQSFSAEKLQWMNRAHNELQAKDAIVTAITSGIQNISVDFIFNLPNQTLEEIKSDISTALELGVKHISIYGLTIEERTVLAKLQKNGTFVHEDERGADLFEGIMNFMKHNHWLHYEISNYAVDESFISKHNSSYWNGIPYLGIGPSAHSYNGEFRWFNVANNAIYTKQISQGNVAGEWESLEEYQRYNEKILIGLRTYKGLSISEIKNQFSLKYINHLNTVYNSIKNKDWVVKVGDHIILTNKGKMLADHVTTLFFYHA